MSPAPNNALAESTLNAGAHSREVAWSWQRICSNDWVLNLGWERGGNLRGEGPLSLCQTENVHWGIRTDAIRTVVIDADKP